MRPSTLDYLRHILDEAAYLLSVTDAIDESSFLGDETLKRACVRSIEIIGEATKQIAPELRQKYSQIEWRTMSGMRDVLIHDYFGVDYQIVWDVVRTKIPHLQTWTFDKIRHQASGNRSFYQRYGMRNRPEERINSGFDMKLESAPTAN